MSLLSNEVILKLLEKLASAELPEPVVIDRHESGIVIRGYTADQLTAWGNTRYAQGAAAQLSANPVAETMCDCYPDHSGTIYAEAVLLRGTTLYTRRQA